MSSNSPFLNMETPEVRAAARTSVRRVNTSPIRATACRIDTARIGTDPETLRQLEEMQATMRAQAQRLEAHEELIYDLTKEKDAPKPKTNPARRVSMACNDDNNNNETNSRPTTTTHTPASSSRAASRPNNNWP
jgi:hypothetical protein